MFFEFVLFFVGSVRRINIINGHNVALENGFTFIDPFSFFVLTV